ncbi:putative RAMP superfamily protein probably involved in DNA repair [Beggiatoa alba B18LD]|uniref:Putative RAMP superfamily protein probably involved in DNA repair n=2 Tax=Beggiatoa alba TaxID=1022 RepID=I3CJU8_9GAMM|nr:putative RAMP superfamily protein probably involved in DNA repair [Beggiatoa alba B18LD]
MSFCRVLISAELKTLSALHVGSGVEKEQGKESYSTLYLDFNKKPYLPASSLRGVLASAVPYFFKNENENKVRQCFFGNSHFDDSKEEGILRVFDATLESLPSFKDKVNTLEQGTILRTSISINPILGVAEEHHLFSLEIVPEGAVFKLEMSLESLNKEVTEENIKQFCGLLFACWDGKQFATVGAGRSKGFGLVKLENLKVRYLTTDALAQWLKDGQPHELNKSYKDWQYPTAELDILKKQGYIVEITLVPKTKFLLNDPAFVIKKEEKEDDEPDLAFSRLSDGRAFIPATALRGWVRGRVRKILLTIGEEKVENCLTSLFGDTNHRGVLFFSDLISEGNDVSEKQIFNAVDRFTGGVADGALYTVEAVQCKGLTGSVAIHHLSKHDSISNAEKGPLLLVARDSLEDEFSISNAGKGLLLLVARDLLEGELTLGWGKSRGFGNFEVVFKMNGEEIKHIHELVRIFQRNDIEQWINAIKL